MRRVVVGAVLAAAVVGVAACGGSDSSDDNASSGASTAKAADAEGLSLEEAKQAILDRQGLGHARWGTARRSPT